MSGILRFVVEFPAELSMLIRGTLSVLARAIIEMSFKPTVFFRSLLYSAMTLSCTACILETHSIYSSTGQPASSRSNIRLCSFSQRHTPISPVMRVSSSYISGVHARQPDSTIVFIKSHKDTCISSGVVSIGLENPEVSKQYLFMSGVELFSDTEQMFHIFYSHKLRCVMVGNFSCIPCLYDKASIEIS